jgi:hypothetical protein
MKHLFSLLLLFLALFLTQKLFATTITGIITDKVTQKPIESASVFLAGTTTGTYTDAEGRFSIHSNEEEPGTLVVTHIGFCNSFITLKKEQKEQNIALKPLEHELQSVQIYAKDSHRKQNMENFKIGLFGNSKAGKNCTILNPEIIHLIRKPLSRINEYELIATADSAILIENKLLGYTLRYTLIAFRQSTYETSFMGYPFFIDHISEIKHPEKTLKAREEAYAGSQMHFLRSVYNKDYENQGFLLFKTRTGNHLPIMDGAYGLLSDSILTGGKVGKHLIQTEERLNLANCTYFSTDCSALLYEQAFEIRYTLNGEDKTYQKTKTHYYGLKREYGNQTTLIKLRDGQAIFFPNGSLKNPHDMVIMGYWGYKKLGELLPWNYQSIEKDKNIPTLSTQKKTDKKPAVNIETVKKRPAGLNEDIDHATNL